MTKIEPENEVFSSHVGTPGNIMADAAHELVSRNAKEIYRDGIKKPLTNFGDAAGTITQFLSSTLLAPIRCVNLWTEAKVNEFTQDLNHKVKKIPKKNLIQPRNSVVGPAVERLKYCLDEKEIRDMFLNLLSASVDSRKAGQVHPSFADIVSQMSPLDAKILQMMNEKHMLPCSRVSLDNGKSDSEYVGYIGALPEFLAPDLVCLGNIFEISASLSNLRRLGLIDYSETRRFTNYNYEEENESIIAVKQAKRELRMKLGIMPRLKVYRGLIELNDLGRTFCEICL